MAKKSKLTYPLPRNFNGSKQCWSCGLPKMLPVDTYYKCSECGATWSFTEINRAPLPVLPGSTRTIEKEYRRTHNPRLMTKKS